MCNYKNLLTLTSLMIFTISCSRDEAVSFRMTESSLYPNHRYLEAKKEMEHKPFGRTMNNSTLSLTEKSILPPGSRYDGGLSSIHWRPDVQDIGNVFEGMVSIDTRNKPMIGNYKFTVVPPAITPVSCGTEVKSVIGNIDPVMKWHWRGAGAYATTYSAPVAGDLDGNGDIEIVTVASTNSGYLNVNGPLVVLKGSTGEVLWNSMEGATQFGVEVSTTPSLMDLDKDGKAEIIAVMMVGSSRKIVIIDYATRQIKAEFSQGFVCNNWCMTTVADIDGDGDAEITAGNVVLNKDGSLRFFLKDVGFSSVQTTTVADLVNTSPGLEIIVNGAQVYSSTGTHLWTGPCRGFTAVADLDNDGSAELICSGSYRVEVYNAQGISQWKKPLDYIGGAPNIGHFKKGENFQIGIAEGRQYIVFEHDGGVLWNKITEDTSSSQTGSTVFDFNGDGQVEVVYNDELVLRIYNGETGDVLWSVANKSGTLFEYPVIVDIDLDGSADIVVSAPTDGGVKVFTDPTKRWVNTRKLWNQYSYYPELVSDSLTAVANPGLPQLGFRVNTQGSLVEDGRIAKADLSLLTPLYPNKDGAKLTFYIFNQGELTSTSEKILNIYQADNNVLVGSATITSEIANGSGLKLEVNLTGGLNSTSLRAELNTTNNLSALECNVENNKVPFTLLGLNRDS